MKSKMETLTIFIAGGIVGISIWEMGRKIAQDYKISKHKSRDFDPHKQIFN